MSLTNYSKLDPQSMDPDRFHIISESSDGEVRLVDDGEFRSKKNKLLFIRQGNSLAIRCPRTKEIYTIQISIDTNFQDIHS